MNCAHQGVHDPQTAGHTKASATDASSIPSTTLGPDSEKETWRIHDEAGGIESNENHDEGEYWDLASMAPLSATSLAAIARLRAYRPPAFPLWDKLPVSRRAAVLVLLYGDRRGDLRVVLTMRAANLRSYSGHAAFPGGKADTLEETPYQIARREASEEIGLPQDENKIPKPFRVEHLCNLPHSLARTELAVRPCIALLHADGDAAAGATQKTVDESLIPQLDAKEVAAVFSGPLSNFLLDHDEITPAWADEQQSPLYAGRARKEGDFPAGKWYDGKWGQFHDTQWRIHYFQVPVDRQRVTKPKEREDGLAALAEHYEDEEQDAGRYLVWGMTGRMLVDTARIAYDREPEFEHNAHFGDEALITKLAEAGRLEEKSSRSTATGDVPKRPRSASSTSKI